MIEKNIDDTKLDSDIKYYYSFDCAPLDMQFAIKGLPSGKIIELAGLKSSGKSTLALEGMKAFIKQITKFKKDWSILYIETESALDRVRAKWMGLPMENILIPKDEIKDIKNRIIIPKNQDTVEKVDKTIKEFLAVCNNEKIVGFIVWDTIAAIVTEKDKKGGGGGMQERPRLINAMLKDIVKTLGELDVTLLIINQVYTNISTSPIPLPMSERFKKPCGEGVNFYSSGIFFLQKRGSPIKELLSNGQEIIIGWEVDVRADKNKLTRENVNCPIVINGENGLDIWDTTYRFLKTNKLVEVAGSWVTVTFPSDFYDKKEKKIAPMEQKKVQNSRQLKDINELQYPHLKYYLDYLIYSYYAKISPLTKIKIIKEIWEMENKFFGKEITELTDKELETAKILYKDISNKKWGKNE